MTAIREIDRRSFLASTAAIGGAFVLGFEFPLPPDAARAAEDGPEINAWVIIHPDDSVVLRYPRAEMGQGSYTAVPMMLAEELECDWSKVNVEIVEPAVNLKRNRIYGDMYSYGSRSVRGSQDYVRKAGAAAREMLIAAAAQEWHMPAQECRAENGRIIHARSERTVSFGKVAARRGQARSAERREAQGPEGLEACRQADEAAGRQQQGSGQAHLRHRRARAEHALRVPRPMPRIQGHAQVDRRL